MFKIRARQLAAFERPLVESFEERMKRHLRRRFSVRLKTKSDGQLLAAIRYGTRRAKSYGIEREYDVRRYLEHMLQHGPRFDQSTWAQPILLAAHDGPTKMNRIDATSTFSVRP